MNASQAVSDDLSPEWAWAPYQPSAESPWDVRPAGHLFRRAGFAANWSQLQQALREGPQRTVDRLLLPPDNTADFHAELDQYERGSSAGDSTAALAAWWLRRMIQTPHPLLERMTLFWHGHFGISNAGVKSAALLARHVQQLRGGALGGYRWLLAAVMDDPALYLWLRCERNRKSQPNENVARQLLHVYGPGPQAAGDQDVRETARALTGCAVLRNELRYFERDFDEGPKTILGQTGPWAAGDAVRIVAEHPGTALALARKLYAWFVSESEEPDEGLLAPLAADLRQHDDVLRPIETILRSNLFFSPRAWRRRIKSPVEFAVGLLRSLEGDVSTVRLAQHLAELGQELYRPPTSRGWAGGRHWLNVATLIGRHNLAAALLDKRGPYEGRVDPGRLLSKYGRSGELAEDMLAELLLQDDPADPGGRGSPRREFDASQNAAGTDLAALALALLQSPEYQLG